MADLILAAVEERSERGRAGHQMVTLRNAGEWLGDVLADALEDALFMTAGQLLEQGDVATVKADATAAEKAFPGAGTLILIKAADWADASEDPATIAAIGLETPEAVAADSGINRWLDRYRPRREADIDDLCETGVVALTQMWPPQARYTTAELIRWWLGSDPDADHVPGGPEVAWHEIARLLLGAIDQGPGPDGPAAPPSRLRSLATGLFAECGREPLLEVVEDALFGTVQWVEMDSEDIADAAAAMNSRFPRAGDLWKAVEADVALTGGWLDDVEPADPGPLSDVAQAPALERWMGERRWKDEEAIEYVAAALAIFADDRVDVAIGSRTDGDLLNLWATGWPPQSGPRPRQWPPAPRDINESS